MVIDYFTKWVEAALYTSVTRSVMCKFIEKEVICENGLSERIIFDNALNLNNTKIKYVCTQFKIKHHNSTLYHPKMNRWIKATNKNIKNIVGKMS